MASKIGLTLTKTITLYVRKYTYRSKQSNISLFGNKHHVTLIKREVFMFYY